ncbi:MAG: ABC transporter permease [Oceanospirillaceae bacterium]|uniref:ABC transporter permease n=1 Tax=unclassified Thalassolituus TaxID=2624967 RepID=UPI000C0B48F4|nr:MULTISPECIES: ABC transporter permease [unclassified Thalassolituus]MAK90985.1 ABC transporter permease [Thalassolituus sp.]MAS24820.1 ABC transporter permease [Oceanospirillaceae bacterium]MBS53218.1 ABC transporter permease [Oceanospirillaceae bacterium]|tara:strand:+ start:369 stop:1436 length:1068 start_codon:yes stop_codon:yes gene_type:complete
MTAVYSSDAASGSLMPRLLLQGWLLARQILWRLPMLVLVSLIVFFILRAIPVDPVTMLLPPGATQQDIQALTAELGLDKNVVMQFLIWLKDAVQGDFGTSIQNGSSVGSMVAEALPMTIQLLFFGFIAGILLGLAIGLVTFSYRGTRVEKVILSINGIMMAIPDYLWAIILIVIFGVGLQWLPFLGPVGANISIEHITGFLTLDSLLTGNWEGLGSSLAHLVLPSLTLALVIATPIARMAYSSLTEVYREDYIHAARLRGVSSKRILMFHALRNASLPTVSLVGVQASVIIGGTLLIESIFGLPGIGSLMIKAMRSFDMQVIQAIALTYAVTVQLINMLTDIVLYQLNPRLRMQK